MKERQVFDSALKRYSIAIGAVVVALALQGLLVRVLGDHNPYHTLWAALILSAWYCGLGPSVVALILGVLGVWYWFIPPPGFAMLDHRELYGMFVFVFFSACIIALGESYRRGTEKRLQIEHELRIAQAELEDRVQARTAELNAANASLQEFPSRLLRVQDLGRRRIARELHDTTGQDLAAMKMVLDSLRRTVADNQNATQLVEEMSQLIEQALTGVRTMSYLLHPPLLDELGLLSAVKWYVEGFSQRSGIKVSLDLPQVSARFSENIELALFRVLQESLTNVHRHAACSAVTVRLEADENYLNLEIKDNGRGIPEERLRQFREQGTGFGVGIVGMRQRMSELGGQLSIQSDNLGTTMVARVPLHVAVPETNVRSASAR